MGLRRVFALRFQAGELVLFIHWRVAERRGGAGDFFFTCSTAALAEVWGQLRRDRLASAW